jgi:hypothetical protein
MGVREQGPMEILTTVFVGDGDILDVGNAFTFAFLASELTESMDA